MLLYHLHFDIPDLEASERAVLACGFRLLARFGYVDGGQRRFESDISWGELRSMRVRPRLVELELGAVNIVLMPARFSEVRLGQIGVALDVDERAAAQATAEALGLRVRGSVDDIRSFVATGQGLDIELSDATRYRYGVDATKTLQMQRVVVGCPDPEGAATLVQRIAGPVASRVQFIPSKVAYASLQHWEISGDAVEPARGLVEALRRSA